MAITLRPLIKTDVAQVQAILLFCSTKRRTAFRRQPCCQCDASHVRRDLLGNVSGAGRVLESFFGFLVGCCPLLATPRNDSFMQVM
jgi:hypothetical protein